MSTTVWVDRETHARLAHLKEDVHAPSMAAAIRHLLDAPQESAASIYLRRRREVDAVCRAHHVVRLTAFGSRARGDARAGSDLDLAVELPDDAGGFAFVRLKRDLEQAFAWPTDIIMAPVHRPRMMRNIARDGVVLYEG